MKLDLCKKKSLDSSVILMFSLSTHISQQRILFLIITINIRHMRKQVVGDKDKTQIGKNMNI